MNDFTEIGGDINKPSMSSGSTLIDVLNPDNDSDNDGLTNSFEASFGSDPLKIDTDSDGLSDKLEYQLSLNPDDEDSDGNGIVALSNYLSIYSSNNVVSQKIQFELLESLRGLMNNEMGMENALGVKGLLDSVIRCLDFSNLHVARQIIKMLSVCTFYSEEGYTNVMTALDTYQRFKQEPRNL